MKKLSLVVLLGIALSAVFTGCSQNDSSTPATTTPPAASTNMPSTNAP